DRAAKDADAVGEVRLLITARGERHPLVDAEQGPGVARLLAARLVLDDDLEVADPVAELGRELGESVSYEPRKTRATQIGHGRTVSLTRIPIARARAHARAAGRPLTPRARSRARSRGA